MFSEKELNQVQDYIVTNLPQLLRSRPEIVMTIEGIVAQHFPRRDEFARLLDEVKESRENMQQQMNRRFELLEQQMNRRFELLEHEMNYRFGQVDQRFSLLEHEMNQRFDDVDQRLEQVDRRFDQVDRRFDEVDRRFEQVDQRFDQVDQRFEKVDRTLLDFRRRFAKLESGQAHILKRLDAQETWLRVVIGELRNEKGRTLEDMFATALSYGLKNSEITPEHIQLRQKLIDSEGLVFPKGFETEVDLIAQNGKMIVFEIKATAKASEVDLFALKVKLVELQHPHQTVGGTFISLQASADVRARCAHYGIELVS